MVFAAFDLFPYFIEFRLLEIQSSDIPVDVAGISFQK